MIKEEATATQIRNSVFMAQLGFDSESLAVLKSAALMVITEMSDKDIMLVSSCVNTAAMKSAQCEEEIGQDLTSNKELISRVSELAFGDPLVRLALSSLIATKVCIIRGDAIATSRTIVDRAKARLEDLNE
jgi:hypothetical protein